MNSATLMTAELWPFERRRRQLERGDAYGRSYDDEAEQHLAAAACRGADTYIEALSVAGGAFPEGFA